MNEREIEHDRLLENLKTALQEYVDYLEYIKKANDMTDNQKRVLEYLKTAGRGFTSPTEIGRAVGGGGRHSAWASPICKRLVSKGLAKRDERGWYAAL